MVSELRAFDLSLLGKRLATGCSGVSEVSEEIQFLLEETPRWRRKSIKSFGGTYLRS